MNTNNLNDMHTQNTTSTHLRLFLSALSVIPLLGFAQGTQLSVGADLALPQGDFSKEFSLGVGPSLGAELPLGDKLGITLQAGYTILLLKEDIKSVLERATLIPVQAGLAYHFSDDREGLYVHGQLGLHSFTEKFKSNAAFGLEEESESNTNFSWAIGAGYRLAKLDLGVRFNSISPKEEEGGAEAEAFNYVGLRVAYLFNLGR